MSTTLVVLIVIVLYVGNVFLNRWFVYLHRNEFIKNAVLILSFIPIPFWFFVPVGDFMETIFGKFWNWFTGKHWKR